MLLGDSHAQQWLPALQRHRGGTRLAPRRGHQGWLPDDRRPGLELARSSVPTANATTGRASARTDRSGGAALVFVSSANMYEWSAQGGSASRTAPGERCGATGLQAMLGRWPIARRQVVVLADTPRVRLRPGRVPGDERWYRGLRRERQRMVDPDYIGSRRMPPRRPASTSSRRPTGCAGRRATAHSCVGDYLVYRDRHHLTATFAARLAERLGASIDAAIG